MAKLGGKGLATSPSWLKEQGWEAQPLLEGPSQSEGVQAEKGDAPATPCCRQQGTGAGAGGVSMTPQQRMGPPGRSAQSPFWMRFVLKRDRSSALLTFNQPTAPIHRALPFLNYSAVAASGGQRQSQRRCRCRTCTNGDRQTDTLPSPHSPR